MAVRSCGRSNHFSGGSRSEPLRRLFGGSRRSGCNAPKRNNNRRFGRPNLLRNRNNGSNNNRGYNYSNDNRNRNYSDNSSRVVNNTTVNKNATYNVPNHLPDQLKSWRQTSEGNCASVAVIKSAVDRFDDKVFKSVNKTEDGKGYDIEMRDGYKLRLSQSELDTATRSSRFRTISGDNGLTAEQKKEGLDFANFAYAAMAKRAANTRTGTARSFEGALHDFENGYNPHKSANLLGLKEYVQNVNTHTLDSQDSVTAWSSRHAIFVDRQKDGKHLEDNWGRATRYDRNANGTVIKAFTLRPDAPAQ
ncbi:MAG: hypothetical protein VYC39_16905 [Myxococcota bacterium]|nr:hypothetical protein [Myxococcota bacterium]